MNNSVNKNSVIITVLIIFIIAFAIYSFIIYEDKKLDIQFIKQSNQTNIISLQNEIQKTMLEKELKYRTKFMLNRYDKDLKLEAFKNQDKKRLQELFQIHYKNLKEQIKGFEIMHFYDKDGNSILRMHNLQKNGDDLKQIRSCVASLVSNPRRCAFFEVGTQGLAYRYTTPIYHNNELLGFFELGIKPVAVLEKIKTIFNLQGYFFIKNEFLPKEQNTQYEPLQTSGYTLCQFCSKKDEFIIRNIKKINLNSQTDELLQLDNKYYTLIIQKIYDAQSNHIGDLVVFNDITEIQNQIHKLIIKSIVIFIVSSFLIYLILEKYITSVFKILNKSKYLLDNTNDAVYVVRLKDASIVDVNERASAMLGFTQKELLEKTVFDIREPMPGVAPMNWEEHVRDLKLQHFITSRGIHKRKDGTTFPVEASLSYIQTDSDECMIAVVRDITVQLELENKIKQKANELERLQGVISKTVPYTTSDLNGKVTSISKAFEELSGYKADEVLGKNHAIFKNPKTSKEYYKNMWQILKKDEQFVGELENLTKSKEPYWVKLTIDPMFDEYGDKIGYSAYMENITNKKELEYISTHDTLTGIYNRAYFIEELSKKINAANRYEQKFGLVLLDIDHFKLVNDTYGHHIGDEVLKAVSNAIDTHIREDDIFARWGGEEFVIIANGADIKQLQLFIEKLQQEIAKVSFNPVKSVTISFGLTVYNKGDNEKSIQKRADIALYKAKNNGRDRYEVEI